ncbi:hypothetical protein NG798_13715 [Ancylothrix sp. C2]|uniref:DUF6930 domain-containing protein n=1 Tax=Ancylothrix sp. D3o TaxID=2953691 RepID=UPI0021BA7CBA|nr:hypothetical protein [Ancylothrix sp. D3o]MCT7950852.1 hypothetical protein [Ancylothrix sp. D3o]
MTALNHSTRRRLQKLPQIPSVWEGDRRPLSPQTADDLEWVPREADRPGECILWVDGSQGFVRSMDMVTPEIGSEAVVRTLLRAMEHPHNPAQPARPQKIVVRDRQLQFYLRGVLQGLEISIEYVPELPLIDEIFRSFQEVVNNNPPTVPPQYAKALTEKSFDIWQDAPWELLGDHQILSIELKKWDIDTLYVCVLGMLGVDYGVLFYRSLESLRRFRASVLSHDSAEGLEEAFLGQDCLFLSYESAEETDDEDEEDFDLADLPLSEIKPSFGNLHPLEGLRSFLYEEEALVVWVALEALHRFWRNAQHKLDEENLPVLTSKFRISLPPFAKKKKGEKAGEGETPQSETISVKVSTEPELEQELLMMVQGDLEEDFDEDEEDYQPLLRDDLVPDNSFLSLGMMPWETVQNLRNGPAHHFSVASVQTLGEGLPIVLIQTSRPKAKAMIQELQEAGGLKGICFNPGEDPFKEVSYDLGILQTEDGQLHLFGEFVEDDPTHVAARKKWEQRCKKTKGFCGLVIAQGLTGAARGNPQIKDMLGLFEVRCISPKELGIGKLQLVSQFDFE